MTISTLRRNWLAILAAGILIVPALAACQVTGTAVPNTGATQSSKTAVVPQATKAPTMAASQTTAATKAPTKAATSAPTKAATSAPTSSAATAAPTAMATTASTGTAAITIHAKDFSFDMPAQIPAGWVTINLINDGKEPHQAQLAKLNTNVTMDQLNKALPNGDAAIMALVTMSGGPGIVAPGQQSSVTVNLSEGQYVALCFVRGADGVPHLAKGMVMPFQVTAAQSSSAAQEPKADQSVTLKDFAFGLPATISAGKQVWKITNDGPQPHELDIVQLAQGKTYNDLLNYFKSNQGVPPMIPVTGMQALSKGQTGYLNLNLPAGQYVVLCMVPDSASGKPHAALGMIVEITVK